MATQTTLTLEQFLALPDREDTRFELSAGELITLPLLGFRHGVIVANIGALLQTTIVYPDTSRVYVYRSGQRNPQVVVAGESFESILGHRFAVAGFFQI